MRILVISFLAGILLSACQAPVPELISPCVGAEGSPCDDRTPVNDWWLKDQQKTS